MRMVIKSQRKLFENKPPISEKRLQAILENPIPQQPKVTLPDPFGAPSRSKLSEEELAERRKQQAEEAERLARQRELDKKQPEIDSAARKKEHEQRVQRMHEEHQKRVAEMRAKSEAKHAARELEHAAAKAAAEKEKTEDQAYLATLSLDELIAVREERKKAIDEAKEVMRSKEVTPEERRAASKQFSNAIKSYQTAFRAVMEKRRQER